MRSIVNIKIRFFLPLIFLIFLTSPVFAFDSAPNNKVGIGVLSPDSEVEEAAPLVNSGGDWGYVVIIIRKNERDVGRWQSVLNSLSRNHLIPIIRLASEFNIENGYWEKPSENDASDWANFLSSLYWPTKAHYIQVYNEVNRDSEWGGKVDPADYAKELEKTINDIKSRSKDFFILEAPLDLSLNTSKGSLDAGEFLKKMEASVPGIFKMIDGWASHSYPNPNFSASPFKSGRTGIDGFKWELSQINAFIGEKELPVFITETGWKRKSENSDGVSEQQISNYYKIAFEQVWNSRIIKAVTPFIFGYPEASYHQFSFKAKDNENKKYFDYYYAIKDLPKTKGEPERVDTGEIEGLEKPDSLLIDHAGRIKLIVKNEGNYIWDTKKGFELKLELNGLSASEVKWDLPKVYPGQEATATFDLKGEKEGDFPLNMRIFNNQTELGSKTETVTVQNYFSFFVSVIKNLGSAI